MCCAIVLTLGLKSRVYGDPYEINDDDDEVTIFNLNANVLSLRLGFVLKIYRVSKIIGLSFFSLIPLSLKKAVISSAI